MKKNKQTFLDSCVCGNKTQSTNVVVVVVLVVVVQIAVVVVVPSVTSTDLTTAPVVVVRTEVSNKDLRTSNLTQY